ncbi:MAG: PIN domain-containing protein [Cyanobacteria bacterium P01_A01_bin.116]
MRYLLDTNVCVVYLNGRSSSVRDRLLAPPAEEMAVCSVVKAELLYGAFRSNHPQRPLERQQAFPHSLSHCHFRMKTLRWLHTFEPS